MNEAFTAAVTAAHGIFGAIWILTGVIGELWLLVRLMRNVFNSKRDPRPAQALLDLFFLLVGWPLVVAFGLAVLVGLLALFAAASVA